MGKRNARERDDLMFEEEKRRGDGEIEKKKRDKAEQRAHALKLQYENDKKKEMTRKFANSSYLTPESIGYLNEVVKKTTSGRVDQEMVYAGLHSDNVAARKFKRTENKKQRYKGRVKRSKSKANNRRA